MALADRFRLVQLTREDLIVASKRVDHPQWGAPGLLGLNLEQYQEKERLQRETAFAKRGSMYWALVDRKPGDTSGGDDDAGLDAETVVFHCLCKTHRFDCEFRSKVGELKRGFAFQVGSVFTRPESRGQGLASFFLALVRDKLAQQPEALVSALYSIIGASFYDKLGWRLYPSTIATLDAGNAVNVAAAESTPRLQEEALFLDDRLDGVLTSNNETLVQHLSGGQYDGKDAFAMLPSRDSIEWQFCVGAHYARAHKYAEIPAQCGVKLVGSDAFVVWCHNIKENALYIVRAELGNDSAAAAQLMAAALREARKFTFHKVVIWNPQDVLHSEEVQKQLSIDHAVREISCSSAIVFNGANDPNDLPEWLANERFAWV